MDGAFELKGATLDAFDLRPVATDIPEDQIHLGGVFYDIRNMLVLLRSRGILEDGKQPLLGFEGRLAQAITAGVVKDPKGKSVQPLVSARALEQIRNDIVRRLPIKLRYLASLLGLAAIGMVLGGAIEFVAHRWVANMRGYGWVVIGAMAGAWLSVAATRRTTAFENLPDFSDRRLEPVIRLTFVGLLAAAFALTVQLKVLSITIAGTDFGDFSSRIGAALFVGIIAGFAERAVATRLTKRVAELLKSD